MKMWKLTTCSKGKKRSAEDVESVASRFLLMVSGMSASCVPRGAGGAGWGR